MRFEWDEVKREINLQKHGVDFADLPPLFEGDTVTVEDRRRAYGEQRFLTVGLLRGRVLTVAHTETEDVIRFISARKATRHEEVRYFASLRD